MIRLWTARAVSHVCFQAVAHRLKAVVGDEAKREFIPKASSRLAPPCQFITEKYGMVSITVIIKTITNRISMLRKGCRVRDLSIGRYLVEAYARCGSTARWLLYTTQRRLISLLFFEAALALTN